MEKKIKIGLLIILLLVVASLIFIYISSPQSKNYETKLNLNEKQEIKVVNPGQYIELVGIDLDNKTATFLAYDKSATQESDKYRFTIKEGETKGIAVSHCELIDVSVSKIESSSVALNIQRKSGCVT